MVNTRLSSHATRRRNLATIFDDSAQRHAVTPPTPVAAAAPAANTATATFLATIRTLSRERFDESVATHVAKKILGGKSERFIGSENNADVLFSKLVPAINGYCPEVLITGPKSMLGPLSRTTCSRFF